MWCNVRAVEAEKADVWLLRQSQAVTYPGLSNQVFGIVRQSFDFLAQPVDEHAQVLLLFSGIGPPDLPQQFAMGNDLVWSGRQVSEQIVFLGRQSFLFGVACNLPGLEINFDFGFKTRRLT